MMRFAVSAERDQVERFSRSVLRKPEFPVDREPDVPFTFAASWLGAPEIEQALVSSLGDAFDAGRDAILHLGQSIEAHGRLSVGGNYLLDLEIGEPDPKGVFQVKAEVRNTADDLLLTLNGHFMIRHPGEDH